MYTVSEGYSGTVRRVDKEEFGESISEVTIFIKGLHDTHWKQVMVAYL